MEFSLGGVSSVCDRMIDVLSCPVAMSSNMPSSVIRVENCYGYLFAYVLLVFMSFSFGFLVER